MTPICIRDGSFLWTSEAITAFEVIKNKLSSIPIWVLPDFSLVFEFNFDTSKSGISHVLSQRTRPIAVFSEKLAGAR